MGIVITVSRQLGAGGTQIASRVASRLGLALVDRQILDRVAEEAGVPTGLVEAVDESPAALKQRTRSVRPGAPSVTYSQLIQGAIYETARKGDVLILGRGAHLLLQGMPGLLRVKIIAPMEKRVQSLSERLSLSRSAAERAIRDSDRNRAAYIKAVYGRDWMDMTCYDLVINTHQIDQETAAEIICLAAETLRRTRAQADTGSMAS